MNSLNPAIELIWLFYAIHYWITQKKGRINSCIGLNQWQMNSLNPAIEQKCNSYERCLNHLLQKWMNSWFIGLNSLMNCSENEWNYRLLMIVSVCQTENSSGWEAAGDHHSGLQTRNSINIGLTVLPPPRTIKTAILNFDEYALNKEGIEVQKNTSVTFCHFKFFYISAIFKMLHFCHFRTLHFWHFKNVTFLPF